MRKETTMRKKSVGTAALALLLLSGPAWALNNTALPQAPQPKEASAPASDSSDFSLGDWFSSSEKPDTKADKASERTGDAPSEPQKDDKPKEKKAPASAADALPKDKPLPAPYKVYATPVIQDEAAPSPYRPEPIESPMMATAPQRTDDTATLAALLKQQLSLEDGPAVPAPASVRPSAPVQPVAAANALPAQYFPILPRGALPDTAPSYLPMASNVPLEADHSFIVRAIVFVHDMNRNASDGLALLTTLSGADNGTTMILTPQFPLELDVSRFAAHLPNQGAEIARWPLDIDGPSWQVGGDSLAGPRQKGISSFTAMDLILLYLADRERFPYLRNVVVVGHGMGADFVQRYAALGQATDVLQSMHMGIRFLAANPSSYLYLTNQRPAATGMSFAVAKTDECPSVNAYPYGLQAPIPYLRRVGTNEIQMRYPSREIMVLLGGRMISDPYLDQSCAAKAQGKDRLTRGQNFQRYLTVTFGDQAGEGQSFAAVPNAGYDAASLLGSYCGLSMLFGDGQCAKK